MNDHTSNEYTYTLNKACYDAINEALQSHRGKGLQELADEDPRAAYQDFQRMYGALALIADVARVGDIEVSKEMDGEHALRGSIASTMKDFTPDIDFESVEVVVAVREKRSLRDRVMGRSGVSEMVRFRVDPPDLAF